MRVFLTAVVAVILTMLAAPALSQETGPSPSTSTDAKVVTDGGPASAPATKTGKTPKGDTPGDVPGALGKVKSIWSAFKGGKYREAIAGILVVLIFVWRRFLAKLIIGKLSPWWVGFVTVLLGFAGSIPEALSAGDFSWGTFIWTGLLTSAEAMLLWQMIGKKLLPAIFGSPKKDEPAPA